MPNCDMICVFRDRYADMRMGGVTEVEMRTIEEAKKLLVGEIRCAVLCENKTFTSDKKGIAPLLALVGEDYDGCVAADKIVGKAAAFVYSKLRAKEIYAEVLSKAAIPVLEKNGIKYSYGVLADHIRNRQHNGVCPMEQTVEKIGDADEAIAALEKKVEELRRNANNRP